MTDLEVPTFDWHVVENVLKDVLPDSVQYSPGPPAYEGTADTVGRAVVISVGGGPGLSVEGTFDRVTVSLDIAGDQNDPDGAQRLATLADLTLVRMDRTVDLDGLIVAGVQRAAGRPSPTFVDDGDRWHYAASYVWQVASGV